MNAVVPTWCIGRPLTPKEATPPPSAPVVFCVSRCNGRTYYNLEFHLFGDSKEPTLGETIERFLIAPEHQHMTLDEMIAAYRREPTWALKPRRISNGTPSAA